VPTVAPGTGLPPEPRTRPVSASFASAAEAKLAHARSDSAHTTVAHGDLASVRFIDAPDGVRNWSTSARRASAVLPPDREATTLQRATTTMRVLGLRAAWPSRTQ